jgi:hypothetical protein
MYQSHHFLSCGKKIYAKNHFKADTRGRTPAIIPSGFNTGVFCFLISHS